MLKTVAMFRRKTKLDPRAMYEAGSIILRSEGFFRLVEVFMLPCADDSKLLRRIEACMPGDVAVKILTGAPGETYLVSKSWQSRLARLQSTATSCTYEFHFSDPVSDTDYQSLLQMNAVETAVEKAVLLTSPETIVKVRYAASDVRKFEIGASRNSPLDVFTVAGKADTSLNTIAFEAVKAGADAADGLTDNMMVSELNSMLENSGLGTMRLLDRFADTPALPASLATYVSSSTQQAVESDFAQCPRCGTARADNWNYCINCGLDYDGGASVL